MSDKPSYLGLLNAIAIAESRAHDYLCAWAEVTPSDDVRCVLLKVAAREGEHGMSFAKRINELGFEVRRKHDDNADKAIALVTSDRTDLEKMEALKLQLLDTGDKPGRYIAEERDTARLLRGCYDLLKQSASDASPAMADDRLASLERKVDALCNTVDELCTAVAGSGSKSNGTRAKAHAK
jgi:rubrerythrin